MGSKFCSCLNQNPSLSTSSSLLPPPPPPSSSLLPPSSSLLPLSSILPPNSSPLLLPSKEKEHISLNHFSIIRSLGKGASGSVLLVKKNSNQKLFAMKIIKKRDIITQGLESHIQLEKDVLQKNKSRFLVKLKYAFQTPSKIYLVMEYMSGGELTSLLRQYKTFPEPLVVFYSAEIVLALEALHSQDVVYRDLKPENILLDAGGHVKLVDFGFSKRIEKKMTNTFAGTPEYMAPEVILGVGHSKAADLWSLGVVVFEMLSGKPPFWSFDGNLGKIVKGIVENRVDFPVYFSENAIDLVGKLLKSHEQERIGYKNVNEIKHHSFFKHINWKLLGSGKLEPPIQPAKMEDEEKLAGKNINETVDSVHLGNLSKITYDGEIVMSKERSMEASLLSRSFQKGRKY